jgi:hypothetical protein
MPSRATPAHNSFTRNGAHFSIRREPLCNRGFRASREFKLDFKRAMKIMHRNDWH